MNGDIVNKMSYFHVISNERVFLLSNPKKVHNKNWTHDSETLSLSKHERVQEKKYIELRVYPCRRHAARRSEHQVICSYKDLTTFSLKRSIPFTHRDVFPKYITRNSRSVRYFCPTQ